MKMKTICYLDPDSFNRKLRETNGRYFNIFYYSKKEDKVVSRTGRFGVKKYLKGIGKGYTDEEKGLITYYDTAKANYRSPRSTNVRKFKFKGITYVKSNTMNARTATVSSLDVDLSI